MTAIAAGERTSPRDGPRYSIVWVIVVLALGVFVLSRNTGAAWDEWNLFLGYADGDGARVPEGGLDGFLRVDAVTPGSAMAAAGVRTGDYIRYDRPIDDFRNHRPGETVGFTLRHGGSLSHRLATLRPLVAGPQTRALAVSIPYILGGFGLTCLIGMFAALRSRGRPSTLLFGAALVCMSSLGTGFASLTESEPQIYPAFIVLASAVANAAPASFLAFALTARRESRGEIPRAWWVVLSAYVAALAASMSYFLWYVFTSIPLVSFGAYYAAQVALIEIGYLLAVVALGVACRESHGQARTRFVLMLAAGGLLVLGTQATGVLIEQTSNDFTLSNPLVVCMDVATIAGAGVFAYAVLRHRVIDVGFAVNRTLVYGVVSALLLVAFGLVEWAVDHFVPISGREKNVLVDASVAVGLFLAFHRVRDAVEHVIEALFFRRWQTAETGLRRFMREAAFAIRADTLTRGFAAALSEYLEGVEAAVYLLDDAGGYRFAGGSILVAGEALDPDDPALIAIRADPKPVVPELTHSSLTAALVAPMLNRSEVIGLAVLGPKPSGLDVRPDQVELIGLATRQVGLDLHALKVGQLERKVMLLEAKLDGVLAAAVPAA